jgi:hypothetical protein
VEEIAASGSTGGIVAFPDSAEGQWVPAERQSTGEEREREIGDWSQAKDG